VRNAKATLLILLLLASFTLEAGPYVGITQSTMSTGLEVGMLSRTFEQNLALSLPSASPSFETPSVQTTMLYRFGHFSPLMIGMGMKAQLGWEHAVGYELGLGFALSLSYEFLFSRGIVFVEGSYLPWITAQGSAIDASVRDMVRQYIRFGYRQVL